MWPSLYLYREQNNKHELYLGEYSTVQGLQHFDATTPIKVIQASTSTQWLGEMELTMLEHVGELIEYLNHDRATVIIDISIELEGIGILSTHDDGECRFEFNRKDDLMVLLNKVLPPSGTPLLTVLFEHPNHYIEPLQNGWKAYPTFDEYLRAKGY